MSVSKTRQSKLKESSVASTCRVNHTFPLTVDIVWMFKVSELNSVGKSRPMAGETADEHSLTGGI